MKFLLIFSFSFIGLILILSSYMINFFPPTKKELLGIYESIYNEKHYYMDLNESGSVTFMVKKLKKIIYHDFCKNYKIEQVKYKKLSEYRIVFSDCQGMDSSAILNRQLNFDIIIGNNGTELQRIDPDENIFYKKR